MNDLGKSYVMSKTVMFRYAYSGKYPICARFECGEPIKIGDLVVPVQVTSNGRKRTKLYHNLCYKEIFVDA